MNSLLKKWDEFWFSRFDPISASVFRVFLGTLIVVFYIAIFPNWERFYSADGIMSLDPKTLLFINQWSVFSWTEGVLSIKDYWWLGFFSAIAFTVGFKTRLATIILYVLQTSMNNRDWFIMNGEDHIFRMLLFYSCFAPLSFSFSLDNYFRKKDLEKKGLKENRELPFVWTVRLMQINIALIYIISLPNKLTDDIAWINGEAIYWTMANNMWSHQMFVEYFYKWDCLLSKIFTYGTIFVEGLFPILVWIRKTKLISIIVITSFQLGIAVLIPNITFFTLSMVCSFWVYMPPDVTRTLLKKYFPKLSSME